MQAVPFFEDTLMQGDSYFVDTLVEAVSYLVYASDFGDTVR